jgi:hypothetical protein
MFVLSDPANFDGLTAIRTGPVLPVRYYRSAAETVETEIVLDNTQHSDFRLSVLSDPANLEGFATIGASCSLLARLHCRTTGTWKTVFSLDNALDDGWHFLKDRPVGLIAYANRAGGVRRALARTERSLARKASVESHPSQRARRMGAPGERLTNRFQTQC